MSKPLQQLRRAAFDQTRAPVDDEVLLQARRLDLAAFDRERDARVSGDVPELPLIRSEMPRDDLVAVQSDPGRTSPAVSRPG